VFFFFFLKKITFIYKLINNFATINNFCNVQRSFQHQN